MVIRSFADDLTRKIFEGVQDKEVSRFPKDVLRVAQRKLDMLHYAAQVQDLSSPPGNRLEKLSGDLKGFSSIRINDQWRVVFKWNDDGPTEVRITDYH